MLSVIRRPDAKRNFALFGNSLRAVDIDISLLRVENQAQPEFAFGIETRVLCCFGTPAGVGTCCGVCGGLVGFCRLLIGLD